MVFFVAFLWLTFLTLTVVKRDRQLKKIQHKLNKFLYEQENKKREAERTGQETGDNSGCSTD